MLLYDMIEEEDQGFLMQQQQFRGMFSIALPKKHRPSIL